MAKVLTQIQKEKLLTVLQNRFTKNINRHKNLVWANILAKLEQNPTKLWSLSEMERTGGEPDVTSYNQKTDEYTICDCSEESPSERRSLCYDKQALDSRKENKPKSSATEMATDMGIELLNENEYRELLKLGNFDTKTSSWLKTPEDIRKLGGAVFADFRYNNVFVYHNGAESYYASRGFRGKLSV